MSTREERAALIGEMGCLEAEMDRLSADRQRLFEQQRELLERWLAGYYIQALDVFEDRSGDRWVITQLEARYSSDDEQPHISAVDLLAVDPNGHPWVPAKTVYMGQLAGMKKIGRMVDGVFVQDAES